MKRRTILIGAGSGLVAVIAAAGGLAVTQMPVTPQAPEPEKAQALGWISFSQGQYTLTLPRTEIGQNITTAMSQIACTELDVEWDRMTLQFHATQDIDLVRSTVGSESIMFFAEPLAQACATLRDAIDAGQTEGDVPVAPRPRDALRSFSGGGLVGMSPRLAQGRSIVTGHPLYASDMQRPGLLFGRVLRAPAAPERPSRPVAWNTDAARAIPGFVAVVEDTGPALGGAIGLGIVADRTAALSMIADVLETRWDIDDLPERIGRVADIDINAALDAGPLANAVLDGTPEDGPWDVDMRVDIPMAAQGAIEPRAAVAEWDDGALTVWAGTQDAFFVRDVLADAFGMNADNVNVVTQRVGGAFGGKMFCQVELEAAALAHAVDAPVSIQWTRDQEYTHAFHRPPSSHRVRARLDDQRISDWDHARTSSHVIFSASILPIWMQRATDTFAGDDGAASGMAAPYRLGRARAAYDLVRLPIHTGPWRGLGAGPNVLAIEMAMDELARVAGADPLKFRLDHIEDPRLKNVLEEVGALSNWPVGPSIQGGARVGRGLACGIYNGKSYAAAVADVVVDADGHVRVTDLWCAHDCGLVINPDQVRAQTEGNLVFSMGMVLSDRLPVENDHVVAETFFDAPIPILSEMPRIHIGLITSDAPPTGAGETAMVAGPGAIANAIANATGVRPKQFPVSKAEMAA